MANEQAEDSAKGCIYHVWVGGERPVSRLPHESQSTLCQ